ncbi:uncharacterized protein LOC122278462 [Carya illinoinensis]|uniref:uncharacterized protein LOC122278462 n=1 Tax=Carya illinoinensis TaxID=32201 RepID=UPI001C72257F|nr:uncharacterized protein LOC122278462 [Carya illinoinensis]
MEISRLGDFLERGANCLIMKLLIKKHYNHEAFKQTMRKVWRLVKGVKFRDLNSEFMSVEFDDTRDKLKVMREGPWSFDKHLVLLKEFDGRLQIGKIELVHAPFWVRLHDLPLMARNEYIGRLVGGALGEVLEVDLDNGEMEWGEYMRVRVLINISKLLLRQKRMIVEEGVSCWVRFSYERLPDLCFHCGILGHSLKECEDIDANQVDSQRLPYGPWLRVGFLSSRRGGGRATTLAATATAEAATVAPVETGSRKVGNGKGSGGLSVTDPVGEKNPEFEGAEISANTGSSSDPTVTPSALNEGVAVLESPVDVGGSNKEVVETVDLNVVQENQVEDGLMDVPVLGAPLMFVGFDSGPSGNKGSKLVGGSGTRSNAQRRRGQRIGSRALQKIQTEPHEGSSVSGVEATSVLQSEGFFVSNYGKKRKAIPIVEADAKRGKLSSTSSISVELLKEGTAMADDQPRRVQ